MSLIAWYPLNGDTLDYSGNGRHGTNSGLTVVNTGKIGKSYQFTAGASGINITSTNFAFLKDNYSMSIWVNPAGNHPQYNGTFISSGNWNSTCWAFGLSQNNTQIDVLGRGYNQYISYTVPINTWTHITCVVSNNISKVYINGVYLTQRSIAGALDSDYSNTYIGRETYGGGYFSFNGQLNDLRIYDHALSEKEIKEISKAKILHYTFGFDVFNSEQKIIDSSGFNNNATLVSGTAPTWIKEGKIGNGAYSFNGSQVIEKVINIPDNITMLVWFKASIIGQGNYHIPISVQSTNFEVSVSSTGVLRTGYMINGTRRLFDTSANLLDGNWHLIGSTYDGSTIKAYKDGIMIGSASYSGSLNTGVAGVGIGGFYNVSTYGMKGELDEPQIYATALSGDDIKELYQTRGSIDNYGNLFTSEIIQNNFKPTVLDYSSWVVGSTGTQGGKFSLNGTGSENQIVIDENPWGYNDVMWQANNTDVTSDADGGWNSLHYPIDKTKLYRYTIWLRRKVIGNGTAYLGCQTSTVYNIKANTINNNPYFWSGAIADNDWRLLVAHVLPYDTTYDSDIYVGDGIYKKDGTKLQNIKSFKWSPTATSGGHRSFLFYSTLSETNQQFYRPRMEIVDGTEPTLEELLRGAEHGPLLNKDSQSNYSQVSIKNDGRIINKDIREIGLPIRYIKDYTNGSTANASNHWVEIEAYDTNGTNIALNKSATSSILTDGVIISSSYYSGTPSVQVDLGDIYIIDYINVRHYYADARRYYNTKVEVSADGIEWFTVFDSAIEGEYIETSAGKTIYCRPQRVTITKNGEIFAKEFKETI